MAAADDLAKARSLSCWSGTVRAEPVSGGLTNSNFRVEHGGRVYFVRIGADIPVHGVMRFNELAATRAAAACGISPGLFHHEPGAIVLDWIEGRPLAADALNDAGVLARVTALVRRAHVEMARAVRGPVLAFEVFHVMRDYAATLREGGSDHAALLPRFLAVADEFEAVAGAARIVFAHNDLLPANILDDGARLWLIDWDYAGFGDTAFDLAGLTANFGLDQAHQRDMLAHYGETPGAAGWRRHRAFVCASLLRETMWSMVSELHSKVDFDFRGYALDNLARFDAAYAEFLAVKEER